jgi:hypothetical protein
MMNAIENKLLLLLLLLSFNAWIFHILQAQLTQLLETQRSIHVIVEY